MRVSRSLWLGVVGALIVVTGVAEASVTCGKPSKCTDAAVVAGVRAAIAAACPCGAATRRGSTMR